MLYLPTIGFSQFDDCSLEFFFFLVMCIDTYYGGLCERNRYPRSQFGQYYIM